MKMEDRHGFPLTERGVEESKIKMSRWQSERETRGTVHRERKRVEQRKGGGSSVPEEKQSRRGHVAFVLEQLGDALFTTAEI